MDLWRSVLRLWTNIAELGSRVGGLTSKRKGVHNRRTYPLLNPEALSYTPEVLSALGLRALGLRLKFKA